MAVLGPLQKPLSESLFVKTENFSFFVDKIFRKCRMTILKLQKDSSESGEHSKCLQSMSQVSRKDFQTHFQKSYFFEKAFLFRQKQAKRVYKRSDGFPSQTDIGFQVFLTFFRHFQAFLRHFHENDFFFENRYLSQNNFSYRKTFSKRCPHR